MISIRFLKGVETSTRVARATERVATPRENAAQTGISSVHDPETTLSAYVLQFLAVYIPVLVSEYLFFYISVLGRH
jgi:hypothetical protein